jgi:chaperonin cofactor prefoldin
MEKFRENSFKNTQSSSLLSQNLNSIVKREPTLEAVLNDFSRVRLKLPTIQTKVRKSVGELLKDLPEQDKFSQLKNFYKRERYNSKSLALTNIGPKSDNSSDLNEDIHR